MEIIMAAPEPDASPSEHSDEVPGSPFLVVGVGASAGGLEAYTELLEALPPKPGLAMLLVSHLDPEHKSHLPEILTRVCKMPVSEATEGLKIQVNHVYVMPPGTSMGLVDGHLTLIPRPPRAVPHMPIDHLFRSLAGIQKRRAAGVVLSGNGSDGAIALQTIKALGGVTFAQDEVSARFPSMPRAATQDGGVDHVLRPREIAAELERIARHPYARQEDVPEAVATPIGDPINDILELVRVRMGVDFSHYKQTTIRRRIFRRMALRCLQAPQEYLELLQSEADEVQNLYQDFLIRVTQFFRDPEAFEALKEKVFPTIARNRPEGSPIRVWVAGCATGEEVYSLAICLMEYLDGRSQHPAIKILATDLNEAALEKARAGVYLDNIEIDVSPERLRRFFAKSNGHYQISKSIRELCVFSRHSMATDPPFSRIDLVSCRNVLIYMDAALQKQVMSLLHYSLTGDGFLFLGTSENISGSSDLFEVVDSRNRIFARNSAPTLPIAFHSPAVVGGRLRVVGPEDVSPLWSALDVQKEADRVLLSRYAPVGVVADETMTVLQFRGRTSPYLEPAPGMATLDLFRMLREGLLSEVRTATNQAKSENRSVTSEGVHIVDNGALQRVRIDVVPFRVPPSGVRFFLILFQNISTIESVSSAPAPETHPAPAEQKAAQLQQEIGALREYLQSVIEEQESTNEELKSANEEILSANEELQSTNEELQTAKEEAQSANEELATVNEELRHRNAELARVNDDLVNLLSGVGIPIVMVGRDLRIRRFTPPAEKAFNLIATDVGRPISDIKSNLQLDDFPAMILKVIDTLTPYEGEIRDRAGHWYSLRIRPYITLENKIDGASIVLVDVDAIRRLVPGP
jgi:two-component system CheB/CheR fusion protein